MIPALQTDFLSQDRQSPSPKIVRRASRKTGSRAESSKTAQSSSSQIVTSTDYDSDTSLEILTGEELVQSMASKKRTRRSRHKRLTSPTKEPSNSRELPSKVSKRPWLGTTRRQGVLPQVDSTTTLKAQKSSGSQAAQPADEQRERSRSKRVKASSSESAVSPTKPRTSQRSGATPSAESSRRVVPEEAAEVRVLRRREISTSPEKKSRPPPKTVIGR